MPQPGPLPRPNCRSANVLQPAPRVGVSSKCGEAAPHQHDMTPAPDLAEILPHGLGQLTRPFGTKPVDAAVGTLSLMRTQQRIVAANPVRHPGHGGR